MVLRLELVYDTEDEADIAAAKLLDKIETADHNYKFLSLSFIREENKNDTESD